MSMRGRKNRRRIDQAAVKAAAVGFAARAGRIAAWTLGFCAMVVIGAFAGVKLKEYLFTSPTFAVEKFTYEGQKRAKESELTGLAGVKLGDNIFQADVLGAERAMAQHPWVKRISIERKYPRELIVRVIEHEPVALAEMGRLYYVSEQGKVFKKLSPGEEGDLPVLSGLTRDEFVAHEEEYEGLFKEALEAIAVYREAGLEMKAALSEVKVDREEGLTFFVGKEALAVQLGFKEYGEKFKRLEKLLNELSRRGARAEVIRLDNRTRPGWVAVQLADARVEGK